MLSTLGQFSLRDISLATLFILLHLLTGIFRSTVSATCNSRLLSDRIQVPDSAFIHSSAVNMQHGASAVRDDPSDVSLQERAWCPDAYIHTELREFVQIDLARQRVIKLIITKGRVAQSKGRQTTPYFYVRYSREQTGVWFEYRKENGTQRLSGNQDAMNENYNTMEPPFVARFIRIYPFSMEPTKTCLKLELLGCDAHGVVEYEAPQGTILSGVSLPMYKYELRDLQMRLQDTSYDFYPGQTSSQLNAAQRYGIDHAYFIHTKATSNILTGGLGKLTDNDTEVQTNVGPFSSFKFVGWKRQTDINRMQKPTRQENLGDERVQLRSHNQDEVRLVFRFDAAYNFTIIRLFLANDFRNSVALPKNIRTRISLSHPGHLDRRDNKSNEPMSVVAMDVNSDTASSESRWIKLFRRKVSDFESTGTLGIGRYVELTLYFAMDWIALGEVAFENHPVDETILHSVRKNKLDATPQKSLAHTSTRNPASIPMVELKVASGHPTVATLAISCSLLAVLIFIGLLCFLQLLRTKRFSPTLCRQFQHDKISLSTAGRPDCFKSLLISAPVSRANGAEVEDCKNLQPSTARMLEIQTKFQHPQICQDTSNPWSVNHAFTPSIQVYAGHTRQNFHAPPQQTAMPMDSNLLFGHHHNQQYPTPPNGILLGTCTSQAVNPITNNCINSSDIVNFLPLSTSQVGRLVHPMQQSTGERDSSGNIFPENAIYTSLPGSDCESQAYSRVNHIDGIRNSGTATCVRSHHINDNQVGNTFVVATRPLTMGQSMPLMHTTLLPPPPCFPLPPLPAQRFSPSSSQESRSILPGELYESQWPSEVKDDFVNLMSQPSRIDNKVWLDNVLAHSKTKELSRLGHIEISQASDYSSATIGSSSNNGYGAYYGTPNVFTSSHGLGALHRPLQASPMSFPQ